MFSPRRELPWDVVEHKEVAPVPAYFDDAEIQILSISPKDVTQTFTFNAPAGASGRIRSTTPQPRASFSNTRSFFALSRSSSVSSESSGTSSSSSSSEFGSGGRQNWVIDSEFTPENTRDALVFARNQLLGSSELKRLGGNVLFFEGWSVTKLRKGDQYRLQVRYHGRPAQAVFSTPPATSFPPFMDILDNW